MHDPKVKIAALFILGLFAILIVTRQFVFNHLRTSIVDSSSPVLKFLHGASRLGQRLIPFASHREEIKRLNSRLDRLSQEMLRLKSVELENERLRSLLYFKKSIPFSSIPAEVIGRDPSNWADSVIINKGRQQSIRPNMAVVSAKGLVGRVADAARNSSRVLLITDQDSKVGAVLESQRQGGLLVGYPGGMCRMIYISLDTEVAAGEKVFTAGYGKIFPKGILIGEVTSVGKEPGRLYKYAIVKPAQDLLKVEEVLCIK